MAAPRIVGGYEVVDRLAVGGMAEIYIAKSRGIDGFEKQYVLKLIHPKHTGDQDFLRMLVDEAKLTAQLEHVNIVQVIGLGIHEDQYFIVMEYVRGKDLFQILNQAYDMRVPMPLDVCTYIAREVLSGLHYAHTKKDQKTGKPLNLVHRDVSPQNILVSWNGEVKVADFGVAKAAVAARPETQAGVIKGKFRYMSPEQAWGEKLDGRSDVFAVSLCLYEMITSSMAYEDEPDMRKMLARMREAKFQPPRGHRSELDEELESILMKGLKRRRQDRWEDAFEYELALSADLSNRTPNFTRHRVAAFLAKLFPDESPFETEKFVSKMEDPATQPISMDGPTGPRHQAMSAKPKPADSDDATLGIAASDLLVEEDSLDSEEHTLRQSIIKHKVVIGAASQTPEVTDEFEVGKTELFAGQHDPDAQLTANLPRPSTSGPQSFEPKPPQAIPTSWMPKEVPNQFPLKQNTHPALAAIQNGVEKANAQFQVMMADPEQRKIVLGVALVVLVTFLILFLYVAIG
ncbi:serine/threonine protein kinase [Microvenator marinus]|uniref:Serine/threonine protein kinase n=1 Tax=Microvenator marinus TaxID=2600177 RepID=A0A5B8XM20_9DELT|nr:serine/threonine-protein kinase [Microvenator marinus]QED26137.1 serine/threonine protein kinase [Microvenator marinus]